MAKINFVVFIKLPNFLRQGKHIFISVIGTDIELRQAALYCFFTAAKRVHLGTLNIHFNKRNGVIVNQIVYRFELRRLSDRRKL